MRGAPDSLTSGELQAAHLPYGGDRTYRLSMTVRGIPAQRGQAPAWTGASRRERAAGSAVPRASGASRGITPREAQATFPAWPPYPVNGAWLAGRLCLEETAALCEQAAEAARSGPAAEVLWLAEQLADVGRQLAVLARAGQIAAAAYEAGFRAGRRGGRL